MPGGFCWSRLRCYGWAIAPVWPVFLAVTAYLLLLFGNDQIEDAILGATQDWTIFSTSACGFYFWNLVFAFTAWFWARLLLGQSRALPAGLPREFTQQSVEAGVATLALWAPRVLGAAIPVGSAAAVFRMGMNASGPNAAPGIGGSLLGVCVVYLLITVGRRSVTNFLAQKTGRLALATRGPVASFVLGELNPIALTFAAIWLALSLAATVWAVAAPIRMGHYFGPVTIVPIGLAGICTGISLIVLLTQTLHVPVFAGLLLLAVVAGYTADNHKLYSAISDSTTLHPPAPSTLDEAYSSFTKSKPRKLLIVATAGGGIRAAYWTAYAFAKLHEEEAFNRALFAISGVSGGSYGAVVYRAMLATGQNPPCRARNDAGQQPKTFVDCTRLYFDPDADGLGPTLVALLFPDLLQRFIPVPIFPDRSRALELAWQDAWRRSAPTGKEELLAGPFGSLWSKDDPLPILLLNGTSVRSGRRIITTNLRLGNDADKVFHDVADFSSLTPTVISASTAVSNSARFPYISPPGTITIADGTASDQIVDGGVFENSGAQTALELYETLMGKSDRPEIGVLQITSDPDLPDPTGRCGPKDGDPGIARFLPDILSAPTALLNSRSARGTAAIEALRSRVEADFKPGQAGDSPEKGKAPYFAIRLSRTDAQTFAPLGWKLSKAAEAAIERAWPDDGQGNCNTESLDRLKTWLKS